MSDVDHAAFSRPPLTVPVEDLPARPGVPFFEGTQIPELTMEHDAEWLGTLVSRYAMLDDYYIAQLNDHANGAQGRSIALKQAHEDAKRTEMYGQPKMALQWAAAARHNFYRTLNGGNPPKRPGRTGIEVSSLNERRPAVLVNFLRVLDKVVGTDDLDEVSRHGRVLFRHPPDKLFGVINTLINNDVDPRAVMLVSPNTLISKDDPPGRLLQRARTAEEKYHQKLAALSRGSDKIAMPKIANPAPPLEAARYPDRYAELARITGLGEVMLQAAFPEVDAMDGRTYNTVHEKISTLSDDISMDRGVRLRDLDAAMPPKPPVEQ